jgi:hypothetical protein
MGWGDKLNNNYNFMITEDSLPDFFEGRLKEAK